METIKKPQKNKCGKLGIFSSVRKEALSFLVDNNKQLSDEVCTFIYLSG